jgi:molybdopterin-containing oxidoreductase family iron-sulfur binding subunit
MDRRTFLKIAGMGSLAFAASCSPESDKKLFALVSAPADMVTGKSNWYASTCRECPAGCGLLASNREGRIIKLEGNPLHPVNKGALCMRGQAALQGLYHPQRLKAPLLKKDDQFQAISFSEARSILKKRFALLRSQSNKVRLLTETVGSNLLGLFDETQEYLSSEPPTVFEPFAYEALKTANSLVFGIDGLPSYRMDQADLLISFGADFLETWLSPVEYAWKFKAMHQLDGHHKNAFIHIGPYRSLTGVNADHWIACQPNSAHVIALGMLNHVLTSGIGSQLPGSLHQLLSDKLNSYTRDRVLQQANISATEYDHLLTRLDRARSPLILGPGTGDNGPHGLLTHVAVNCLNLSLDPNLKLLDFEHRHRVEMAAKRSEVQAFFKSCQRENIELLLINNTNPVYAMASGSGVAEVLSQKDLFVVCFSNFVDETTSMADLILPVRMPLETWDEYGGLQGITSTLQPTMGALTRAPHLGDVLLQTCFGSDQSTQTYKDRLIANLSRVRGIDNEFKWAQTLQQGGQFELSPKESSAQPVPDVDRFTELLANIPGPTSAGLTFQAQPSIRFFDGRGANRPWLCEIPDPLQRIAWQTPVAMHPETAKSKRILQEDIIDIQSKDGRLQAPVVVSELVAPGLLVMDMGQGHPEADPKAPRIGLDPLQLISGTAQPESGGMHLTTSSIEIQKTGHRMKLASTSGSRIQHGRTLALDMKLSDLKHDHAGHKIGLTMGHFPLTLPLEEGYDPKRDVYPPHAHDTYRWGMVVDLDRCIGCNACAAACYAENNIGIVGEERILEGREMGWMSVERYHDPDAMHKLTFLPMMCQHCDNAPCESVCPVYAPHHSKEGLNNQIYNRCIGTRYCVQNCPYKVRRFNWFTWQWPEPLNLQLNPDVTVRSKGVMEKCSFCIQRIKVAHNVAKNENRQIRDGEVKPACVQTCPTRALSFGNLMDLKSKVRRLTTDSRAYQALGYLNTKPAVIYLKKVVQEI